MFTLGTGSFKDVSRKICGLRRSVNVNLFAHVL